MEDCIDLNCVENLENIISNISQKLNIIEENCTSAKNLQKEIQQLQEQQQEILKILQDVQKEIKITHAIFKKEITNYVKSMIR